jgi:ABC-type sulfate/molybdate transport systems ATPase subunit
MDIRFHDVEFHRDRRFALTIPQLAIGANRVTAVLGPNGAGKSTLLRLIAGLERPVGGQVTVGDERPDPRQRRVAFAFQEHVFLRRSLQENVELALRLGGKGQSQARHDAAAALALFGIADLADRRPDQVSGGERRRGSLARALAVRAPVVLLDEPLAGLDGKTYAQLLDDLGGLHAEFKATTVFVTHNRDEAFRIADDFVVLVNGRVLASGTKRDVATNPCRREVAEALGYAVIEIAPDRQIAIPPGLMRIGSGRVEFEGVIESVTDLIESWDVLARVGDTRLRVALPRQETPPSDGARVRLHADHVYDLD